MGKRPLSWSGWQGKDCSLAEPYRATKTSRQLVVAQIFTIVTTGGRQSTFYAEVDQQLVFCYTVVCSKIQYLEQSRSLTMYIKNIVFYNLEN